MTSVPPATIGQRLRAARRARGLTLIAVAQRTSLTWQQVAALEDDRTRSPAPHLLHMLSAALEVSFAWLCTGAEDAPGEP
jgi:transcriptional regulator with XRE-family HTH domain